MSEGEEVPPKMPGQTPLSPPRGSGVPLVAMSDSIVPTLANLTLQQEQEQAMEAAVQQQQQQQQQESSNALASSSSSPSSSSTLQAGSSSIPSSLPTASNDAALPASSTTSSTSTLNTPNVQQQQGVSPSSSSTAPAVVVPPVIKSKDFAASMAAAASSSPSSSPANHSLRQPQVDGGSSSPRSPLSSSSTTTTTTTPATTTIASPPPASATPTPRTATPSSSSSSSSSMASSASTSTVRPGLQPSASSSSAIRRPGVGGQGAGLAARIPPSLQAKMAAMAQRSSNPTQLQFAKDGQIGAQDRIPTSAFLRQSSTPPSASPGPSSSSSLQQPSLGQSGPGRPSPMMMTGGAVGRVGSAGPMAMGPGVASRSASTPGIPTVGGGMGVSGMGGLKLPGAGGGIAKRRGPASGLNLNAMGTNGSSSDASSSSSSSSSSGNTNGAPAATGGINGRAGRPAMKLPPASTNGINGSNSSIGGGSNGTGTPFSNFSKIVDPSGSLNFQNKAVLHAKGVDFSTGASFNINMDELELQDELGSGNYGTVQKVYHKITKVTMAMKEIRLELDDSKLKGIITELDVLHRATAPEIVEFYGAFFIESCVYYCMEYMDAGSLDKMSVIPVPEPVLQRVTASMVRGLKFLKDKLQIMHRDVKPTNVLINTAGMVKLCDFGVSGQLERSLAKTNIGCQSYMAPERIKGESQNFLGTYTVSSDVWSLGLSIVEFTLGRYPYPPETYSNVFAQLTAIVHGDPPCLPDGYSKSADDFVAACLQKDANKRPSYAQLLRHPFLATEAEQDTDMIGWVKAAMEKRASMKNPPSSSSQTVQ